MAAGELLLRTRIDPEDRIAPSFRLRNAHLGGINRPLVPRRVVSVVDRLADRREKSQAEEQENLTD
jgi:hypothetical protein